MNKARRQELKELKYKKRVNIWGKEHNSLKSHSTPCSCYLCRDEKYNRANAKENAAKEFEYFYDYSSSWEIDYDRMHEENYSDGITGGSCQCQLCTGVTDDLYDKYIVNKDYENGLMSYLCDIEAWKELFADFSK